MGLLQATEGLKVLLDIGDSLSGRLLIYDALDGAFSELQLQRDPNCPACGDGELVAPADDGVFALPTPATTTSADDGGERMTAIRIPPVLRAQAGNQKKVEVTGSTVGEALESLIEQFPGLREQIFTDDGSLNRFVNVYVNGRDVRYEQELATPVEARRQVVLLPAMAGGR